MSNCIYPEPCMVCRIPREPDGCVYYCTHFERGVFHRGRHTPSPRMSCADCVKEYADWYKSIPKE